VVTYNTLVDAYCKAQKPQGARALVGEMAARGLPVTHQTLHPLLQEEVAAQALSLEAALALAESLLGGYGLRPSHVTVCTVMEAMLAMERPADAVAAFLRSYTEGACARACLKVFGRYACPIL
jgi:pentatricopeptide repeat protein